jgi:hypothetical protein
MQATSSDPRRRYDGAYTQGQNINHLARRDGSNHKARSDTDPILTEHPLNY